VCGICGIADPRGAIDVRLVHRMNAVLRHRGPDADAVRAFGACVLAYNRLSIIDLKTGDQPIADESGRVWIVYNGEIYNYKELREGLLERGHSLRTNSDTEAIVHLYEEKGPDCVLSLNGMFAFAIWDDVRGRLLLARDRLGIKPLYYTEREGRIAFASEIKGLLADPSIPRRLDYRALSEYLTFQNVFGEKTFFEGVRILPPGHLLIAEGGKVEVREYWDLHFKEDEIADPEEAVRRFGALFDESVEMQLMSDVALGSHLSGGIDSGTVVMKASDKVADPLKTFSVYFEEPDVDESALIEKVSMLSQSIHYDRLLDPEEFPSVLPKIAYALDEPRVGPSVIPQWYIAELASKEVRVVLTGHGGDELFAGYPSYVIAYFRDILRRRDWAELRSVVRAFRGRLRTEGWRRVIGLPLYGLVERDLARYGREAVFKDRERMRLLTDAAQQTMAGHDPRAVLDSVLARCDATSLLNRILYLDIKTYLPSLLIVEDRMSMAHSLEDRVPLLDHRIAELSSCIPGRSKIRGLILKWIPRKNAEGVLPRDVIDHRKVGFLVPLAQWLRGPLRRYVEDTLLSPQALARGIFRPEAVRAIVRDHMTGRRDASGKIWSLLNVELWHRTWIDPEGEGNPKPGGLPGRPGPSTRG